MSARLKRLEGMVREMMDTEVPPAKENETSDAVAGPAVQAHVVRGQNATTYVGATHCMAMLEDVRDDMFLVMTSFY